MNLPLIGCLAGLGLALLPQTLAAQDSSAPPSGGPAYEKQMKALEAQARQSRQRAEELELIRDRRMKSVAKSICTGC